MKRVKDLLARMPRRWRRMLREGQSGQAVVESSIMLFTLLVTITVGTRVLMRNQPDMMNALTIYMSGFYFTLSLPFP
jgi:hypothetical protein